MTAALRVLGADLPITVQDLGRPTAQRFGVPTGGAMDRFALTVANRLVGNPPDAAALEITVGGAALEVLSPVVVAITGADLGAELDDRALPLWTSVYVRPGQLLQLTRRRRAWGARAYLAIAGGLDVPVVLGARGTSLAGGFGGVDGRPLRLDDILLRDAVHGDLATLAGRRWPENATPRYVDNPAIHVLPGPHREHFERTALDALTETEWTVGAASNRMGYRLAGAALPVKTASIASHGVVAGALQVPPDGAPILLMADAQTTGGYPIVAVVVGADLPLVAQLLPGDRLRFRRTTAARAVAAWRALDAHARSRIPEDAALAALGLAGAGPVGPFG